VVAVCAAVHVAHTFAAAIITMDRDEWELYSSKLRIDPEAPAQEFELTRRGLNLAVWHAAIGLNLAAATRWATLMSCDLSSARLLPRVERTACPGMPGRDMRPLPHICSITAVALVAR
jgi:hypothetical protein